MRRGHFELRSQMKSWAGAFLAEGAMRRRPRGEVGEAMQGVTRRSVCLDTLCQRDRPTGPERSKSQVILSPGDHRGVWIFFKNQWEGL